jgi:hypothetical protein
MTIIEQGSYMQEVRTAVGPEVYKRDQDIAEYGLAEWLARICDDVVNAEAKTLRLMAWLSAFQVLPGTACSVIKIAKVCSTTAVRASSEMAAIYQLDGMRDFEASDVSPEALMMIRVIGHDIIAKRGKPMRLINWTRVLKVSPPNLTVLQDVGNFCGVSRQAVKKDCDEILAHYPEIAPSIPKKHNKTNHLNHRIK